MAKNKGIAVIFLAILLIGGVLRFYHIQDIGPIMSDPSWRISETRFLIESFKWAKDNPRFKIILDDLIGGDSINSFRQFVVENKLGNFVPTNAKPYINFFIVFFNLIFRIPIEDAGNVMAAFFGFLVVVMAFFLGKTFYDTTTGLISAAVAAVSGYQIMYSGHGFDLSPAVFFVMLSLFFYYHSRAKGQKNIPLFLSGLSAGIAFGCHTSLVLFLGILFLYEMHLFLSSGRNRLNCVKRAGLLVFSVLIPLVVAEIAYLYLRVLTDYPHFTYFEQLLFRFKQQGGFARDFDANVFILPHALLIQEGYIVTALLAIGIFAIATKRWLDKNTRLSDLIIFVQFLIPIIWWAPHHNHIPRLLIPALSTLPLLAARGGLTISKKPWLTIALILLILTAGLVNLRELITLKPGYKAAFEYMRNHKGEKHLSTTSYISDVYYKGKFSPVIDDLSASDVKQLVSSQGYKYLLVDWQKYHYIKHPQYNWLKDIEEKYKPVYEISNRVGLLRVFLYENSYDYKSLGRGMFKTLLKDKGMGLIRIYDLEE